MRFDIHDKKGGLRISVSPDESSAQTKSVMGDNTLNLSFTTFRPVAFDIGDWVEFCGERYELTSIPCPREVSTMEYEYALLFVGVERELSKALCFLMTDGDMDSDFSLTDGPAAHLQLVVDNINRIKGTTAWKIGSVTAGDYKVVTYDGIDCLTALNRIAEAFETEWWIVGTTIYLSKCEHGELLELGYAADGTAVGGLLNLSKRDEENDGFFTRMYAKGGTRNVERAKYGSDNLRLPAPLKYLEKNVEYGIVEREVIFEEVYPRRIGTLSSVRSISRLSNGKTLQIYYVTDKDLPFNPSDYEIGGLVKRMVMQTGELSGYDFEVNYDSSTKEFELINQYPDENTQIPGGVMEPKAGDTYILYNIRMPDEYYPLAEKELKEVAEAYLEKHSADCAVYSGDSDPIIFKKRNISVSLGQRVRLHSRALFQSGYRDSRIIGFTRYLSNPYNVKVNISEVVGVGRLDSLERKIDSFLPQISQAGGSLNLIKSGDDTVPTDNNVFSALKAISTFLRKDKPDETRHLMKFLGGLLSDNIESLDFSSGPFGSGFVVKRDPKTGKSYIEADEIYIRLKSYFDTLEIKHLSHVGGRIVLSPASMECAKVEDVSAEYEELYDSAGSRLFDSTGDPLQAGKAGGMRAYRCYFKQTDGEREIINGFAVDDLAQCREFNVKTGTSHNVQNQYYWRRVINVGDDYIDLSIDDCDTGSMMPKAGDTIVTIGNKTDAARQHVVFLSSYDDDAPCIKLYSGVNSYSMKDKEVTVISPNADKNVFTGKMVIKPGSTGFENLTDAPNMTVVERNIQDAQKAADEAKKEARDVKNSVGNLKGYVDGAFADGIVTEAEAKSIEKYLNIVDNEKQQALATYNGLYNNPYLEGSAKVSLSNAKASLFSAIEALATAISTAIADGKATAEEKADVDKKYATFTSRYNKFYEAVEVANKAIQDKLKGYADNAKKAADEANNNASLAMERANEAKNSVGNLKGYVDGAFADGIVTEAEAAAIEKYINMVNQTKREADATYQALYANTFLTGLEKTNLYVAKNKFDNATTHLTNAINAAIADGKATAEEKANVDNCFTAFNEAYASLATAIENANKAIQKKIKEEAVSAAKSELSAQIGQVSQKDKDDIAKMMGYKDFNELSYYAERGMTIINGGSINTSLINADLMITSALIAKAIMTNTLNVNNKFKVYTNGSVDMNGILHSLGRNTELVVSDGYVRIMYKGNDVAKLSVNENTGMPELSLYQGDRAALVTADKIMLSTGGDRTSFLTLDASVIGYGTIKKRSDGLLYLANNEYYVITVDISVYPDEGGTTIPSPSPVHMVMQGESEVVEAIPATGYKFDRWSDGGSQKHTVTWSKAGQSICAYFKKIPVTQYTLTLSASPSNGGVVSGGGSYEKDKRVTVNATANSGWRFVRWSDGMPQSHTVTMDANKSLTAYFEKYNVTGDEIFSGTALTSTSWWSVNGNATISSVSGGVAVIRYPNSSNIKDQAVFNRGYIGSKLVQGHRYRMSLQAKSSVSDSGLVAYIGGDGGAVSGEDVIWGEALQTSYKTFTLEFRASRNSDAGDGLCLAVTSACTLWVKDISLKEV